MRRCLGVLGIVLGTVVAHAQERDAERSPSARRSLSGPAAANQPSAIPTDAPLTSYAVEVLVVDSTHKPGEPAALDLSRSAADILAQVEKLPAESAGTRVRRIHLTAVENLPSQVQFGRTVAVTDGRTLNFGGRERAVSASYRNTSIGVIVQVTARATKDGIAAELTFEESRLEENAPMESDEGTSVTPPAVDTTTAKTTVTVKPGEPVIVGGMSTKSDTKHHDKAIIATITPHSRRDDAPRDGTAD